MNDASDDRALHDAKATSPIAEVDAAAVLRLRFWHHVLNEMLKRKQFKVPVHLAFGHEAAAVALDRCLGTSDAVCLSHRNVAYNLARCKSLESIVAHYQLAANASPHASMGSMNLAAEHTSIAYSSSILGNNLPVATGIAMNRRLAGKPGVVFVFTGDGAMEEGAFWETLVFARSHRLALVVIVENNNCSMSSTIEQRRCGIDLAQVCAGIGARYYAAHGAVYSEVSAALAGARADASGGTPACVELELTTFNQHAGPTPGWPGDPLNIDLKDGLLVKDDPSDPVHHLRQAMGARAFEEIANDIIHKDSGAKYLH